MQLRWPWVSRSEYDRVEADRGEWHDAFDRMFATWQTSVAEVRRLTDILVEMKRDGFHPAAPVDAMPSPEPDLPSQITEAIMARSTRKSDLERELYRYAIRTYTGQNAEEIAGTIWHGGDPQEDDA